MADQIGIASLIAGETGEKLLRTRSRDGAQIVNGFLARQTDAVVGDREGTRGCIVVDADLQFRVVAIPVGVVNGFKAQLVACIRCIGDKLTQKDFAIAVKRMDHQLQQLFDFGLKAQGFLGRTHVRFLAHLWISRGLGR